MNLPNADCDVITFGETMLRLTPPGLQRLESAVQFEAHVGGSESNVAVGLARLGLRVAWLSRLTLNPLGRQIAAALRAQGVDTSLVIWTEQDRVGLYFLEEGKAPRGSQVLYDRAHSALSRITPADLPPDLFVAGRSRVLHLSGITPALSPNAAQTARTAAQQAREAGWLVSFDLNYRANLWSATTAAQGLESLIQNAHVIYLPLRDAALLYGMPPEPEKTLVGLQARFPGKIIVLTLGGRGAAAIQPSGDPVFHPGFEAEEVGRVGGGDAFVAGFLFAYLQSQELTQALQWGNAAAAFKYSIPGDMPLFSRAELEKLIHSGGDQSLKR
ncbi:MAG: sugar kinase [Anaerolinea sp.]|nr:sugar kinase [Anaerolinea sp.]MCC6974168.1 sugar kinase [Anaerolineae bacterium]CAG0955095.1 2-dehydro-3-deoxygluconokinase [Anaerolineae bacterium]